MTFPLNAYAAMMIALLVTSCDQPTWRPGTCVRLEYDYERWQSPHIRRIEEVGKQSYRVSIWHGELGWSNVTKPELEFRESRFWKEIACPSP